MSKILLDVIPRFSIFQDKVITPLKSMWEGAEWLNDATSYTKQETIYKLLILKYGDRKIRYDNENIFINRLIFELSDIMPDIYAKQQVFITNQLGDFLKDNKSRAIIFESETNNKRDSDSNSKLGNSSSPLNLVISNASEINNAPITSSNLSNVKLVENYNGNNQQVNYNFVNDLVRTLNADYSLRINEFMEMLAKHFSVVVGSYYSKQCTNQTIKDEPYRFNNGYLVNEVDYLGTQNKQEIDRFNEKLEQLNTKIQTKQDQITAGENITITGNNVINAIIPKVDLSSYYTKDQVDLSQKNQDTIINQNTKRINDIIDQLSKQGLLVYKGQYIDGTKYMLGNTVSYEGKIYVCKVLETTNNPSNTNDWDVLALKDIDLSDYYTREQVDQMLQDLLNQINVNKQDIITLRNDLGDLGNQVNDNTNELTRKQDRLTFKDDEFIVENNNVELSPMFTSRIDNLETQQVNLTQEQEKQATRITTLENNKDKIVSGNHSVFVDGTNVYKNVGYGNEVLASEEWIEKNFQTSIKWITGQQEISASTNYIIMNTNWDRKIITINIYRKRTDGNWFLYQSDGQQSQYFRDSAGNVKIWSVSQNGWTRIFYWEIAYID